MNGLYDLASEATSYNTHRPESSTRQGPVLSTSTNSNQLTNDQVSRIVKNSNQNFFDQYKDLTRRRTKKLLIVLAIFATLVAVTVITTSIAVWKIKSVQKVQRHLSSSVYDLQYGQEHVQYAQKESQEQIADLKDSVDTILSMYPGVRLVDVNGSTTPKEGRLEIFHAGEWGSVCRGIPYYWGVDESRLVCDMLGFKYSTYSYGITCSSKYGSGSGLIWLDGADCSGSVSTIYDCKHNDWGSLSCSHLNDICIICK